MTGTTEITDSLTAAGFTAEAEQGPSPTEVVIFGASGQRILLARAHNVPGWEAVLEPEPGTQIGLEDGPSHDAPASEVTAWMQRLFPARPYCEGCEGHELPLNPAGYCARCIAAADRDGHGALVR